MFGSNGPYSPTDYLPQYTSILEPIYYPTGRDTTLCQNTTLTFESDPECHNSAPPTPDIISGLVSLNAGQYCSSEISSGSFGDLTSPDEYQSTTSSPPSYSMDVSKVQATRSKLIKEGLKLTIQSRRMVHGLDNIRAEYKSPPKEELTKEDEERRRRRRERNKVAATKCRNKKKERTGRLAQESETLEVSNSALKSEIHTLEAEKKELLELLQGHLPHCAMQTPSCHQNYCSMPAQVQHNQQPTWSSTPAQGKCDGNSPFGSEPGWQLMKSSICYMAKRSGEEDGPSRNGETPRKMVVSIEGRIGSSWTEWTWIEILDESVISQLSHCVNILKK